MNRIAWDAVQSTDFRDVQVKEGKQAEFLIHDTFPWQLVEQIGVIDKAAKAMVETILASAHHKPVVQVERSWYY